MFKRKRRPVLIEDIRADKGKKVLYLKKEEHFAIKIHKQKTKDFIKKNGVWFGLTGVFLVILIILSKGLLTNAQIANFYPNSCLGGWENSKNAEGQPEVVRGSDFNTSNSAFLNNRISQIYCGDFMGELPEDSNPKKNIIEIFLGHSRKEHKHRSVRFV